MPDPRFILTVRSRQEILYDGEVISVSSVNERGPFDVLRQHAQFISLITDDLVIRKPDGTTQVIALNNGIMRVRENSIEVYIGIDVFLSETGKRAGSPAS